MTPCARQIMNRIPGDLKLSWAGYWGRPTHVQRANEQSRAVYILTQEKPTTSKTNLQTQTPHYTQEGTKRPVWHLSAIWNHLHSDDSCGFQWRDVDAVIPEFPLVLQNTSPEYFRHPMSSALSRKIWCRYLYPVRTYWHFSFFFSYNVKIKDGDTRHLGVSGYVNLTIPACW